MNNTYYETLDENFTQALKFFEAEYSHIALLAFLKSPNSNIVQKQLAALCLDGIFSKEDAQILLSNLTGQDGKIREAVSFRLNEFMANPEYLPYFEIPQNYEIFLDAVIDINGNICRNVISAVSNLKNNSDFCRVFCCGLTKMMFGLLDNIETLDLFDGKYKVNKEVFKLYWCLETAYVFWDKFNIEDLKKIILRSKNIQEYTIREKTAKILSRGFEDEDLKKACEELKNDSNYYVRRI